MSAAALSLAPWHDFYVVIGSSAAALTGLTFVVIALASDARMVRLQGLRTFITPMVVHFCSAVGVSALMCAPGHTPTSLTVLIGGVGLAGSYYSLLTGYRMHRMRSDYQPFLSDWIWNVTLPLLTYLLLLAAAALASRPMALNLIAAVALSQLFIGIHNAWDIAVWITAERPTMRQQLETRAQAEAERSAQGASLTPPAPPGRTGPQP